MKVSYDPRLLCHRCGERGAYDFGAEVHCPACCEDLFGSNVEALNEREAETKAPAVAGRQSGGSGRGHGRFAAGRRVRDGGGAP